ncbi:hypothetical protein C6P45_004416 [Maudiozyma exigua]|uniref:BRCT domain-containing protein n=1 Tax=Maudiozyma exigua TaxID=34358 RepID=A0A9P6WE95_MAUEX|nr:hypothetical protein C6P45_004416 [Kazachstania exigua]
MSLFQDLNILIVATNKSQLDEFESTRLLLEDNGCNNCIIYESLDIGIPSDIRNTDIQGCKDWFYKRFFSEKSITDIHFIISLNTNYKFYSVCAYDLLIPIVTPDWVQDSLNCNRLNKTTLYSPNPKHFFRDLEFYVSKCTFNDNEYLFYTNLIVSMGGSYTDILSTDIDFLISRSFMDPSVLVVQKGELSNDIKFIFPTWILECYKTGESVPYEEHLLASGTYTDKTQSCFNESWTKLHNKEFSIGSNILTNKNLKLDKSLKLDHNVLKFLKDLIEHNDGTVIYDELTESNTQCETIVIACHASVVKSQRSMTANLVWLFDILKLNSFVSPDSKIIYKPFKDKIFDEHINVLNASFTKYFGYQRSYIKLLVEKLGGKATTDFSKRNNFLICQIPRGRKYNTAMTLWKGKCTVVNHLWLEDCYLLGEKLDPSLKRYSTLPLTGLETHINQVPNSLFQRHNYSNDNDDLSMSVPQTMTQTTLPTQLDDIDNSDDDILNDPIELPSENEPVHTLNNSQFSAISEDDVTSSVENERIINKSLCTLRDGINLLSKTQSDLTDTTSNINSSARKTPENPSSSSSSNYLTANMGPVRNLNEQLSKNETNEHESDVIEKDDKSISVKNETKREKDTTKEQNDIILKKKRKIEPDTIKHDTRDLDDSFNENRNVDDSNDVKAKEIVETFIRKSLPENEISSIESILPIYDIRAIQTSCLDNLTNIDLCLLKLLGVQLFNEIKDEYKLNAIFAPKLLRTQKFLQSLSFTPLRYALKPDFVENLLKSVRRSKIRSTYHSIEEFCEHFGNQLIEQYSIKEISDDMKHKTELGTKIFERAHLSNVNIFQDINGGTDTIRAILESHGVKKVNILNSKFSKDDILKNDNNSNSENFTSSVTPDYLVIATKTSEVKKLKQLLINSKLQDSNDNVIDSVHIVTWNWCVNAMFTLQVDFKDPTNVLCSTMNETNA